MHHLGFEKVVDKIERKYEAVVRMSVKAREMADSDMSVEPEQETKVTTKALNGYLTENHLEDLKGNFSGQEEQEG